MFNIIHNSWLENNHAMTTLQKVHVILIFLITMHGLFNSVIFY